MRRALVLGAAALTRVESRYVPLCHFKDCLNQISETNERGLPDRALGPDFVNRTPSARAPRGSQKNARCGGCRLYAACEGIWNEYLRNYGDAELKPVK